MNTLAHERTFSPTRPPSPERAASLKKPPARNIRPKLPPANSPFTALLAALLAFSLLLAPVAL